MKKIFVGNLSRQTTDGGLQAAFSQFGAVRSVMVMMDRMTGEPRGFAFVEMENDNEAAEAINQLNGKELDGRKLTVNEARPKTDKPRGPGGGGGGRGGYGGGGGRGGYGGGGGRGGYGGEGGGRGGRGGYR